MRTDEIAPRVALTHKKWPTLNPAFGGLMAAFIAGLYAESAFHAYLAGAGLDVWSQALMATFLFVMAILGVVRGLRKLQ